MIISLIYSKEINQRCNFPSIDVTLQFFTPWYDASFIALPLQLVNSFLLYLPQEAIRVHLRHRSVRLRASARAERITVNSVRS